MEASVLGASHCIAATRVSACEAISTSTIGQEFFDDVGVAAFVLTLATNLWATSLISLKAWCVPEMSRNSYDTLTVYRHHRRRIRQDLAQARTFPPGKLQADGNAPRCRVRNLVGSEVENLAHHEPKDDLQCDEVGFGVRTKTTLTCS